MSCYKQEYRWVYKKAYPLLKIQAFLPPPTIVLPCHDCPLWPVLTKFVYEMSIPSDFSLGLGSKHWKDRNEFVFKCKSLPHMLELGKGHQSHFYMNMLLKI